MDALLVLFANIAAFLLRYDAEAGYHYYLTVVAPSLPVLIGLRLAFLYVSHLYRIRWRYMSIHDLRTLAGATTLSSLLFFLFLRLSGNEEYSRGMQIIDWGINIFLLSGIRICYRQISDLRIGSDRPKQRALIVGAGDAGEAVARDLLRRPGEGIVPVGFVDDDVEKRRSRIHGLPVLGTTHDIGALAAAQSIEVIIIAIPSAPGTTIRDIVGRCERTQARLCIVPSVPEILEGQAGGGGPLRLRDVKIEDLLRRAPVRIDMEQVAKYIAGQRVLVTGAGGSIGSELCRQICTLNPARLILVGQGENSIFEIEQELVREYGFAATALVGDIKDRERMEDIFLHERPTVVFHAAAHKHVPLMEANPQEAVKNNVLGTRNLAELAHECGVKKFIYVSTDKAVNPTSVMGATKRIGEMIVQSMAPPSPVEFAAVRFGNVLGSRGSVIPTMRKQIARGGPITVTDPKMTRYFMTIPEAVQLILQAGAMGKRGEIYILDMGEPVRILDLARDLVRLSGLRPDVDIKIEFTGARPGEKIFEQLTYDDETTTRTPHEKIFVSNGHCLDPGVILRDVDHLIRLATQGERDTLRDEILRLAHNGCPPHEREGAATPAPVKEIPRS